MYTQMYALRKRPSQGIARNSLNRRTAAATDAAAADARTGAHARLVLPLVLVNGGSALRHKPGAATAGSRNRCATPATAGACACNSRCLLLLDVFACVCVSPG